MIPYVSYIPIKSTASIFNSSLEDTIHVASTEKNDLVTKMVHANLGGGQEECPQNKGPG